MNGERYIKSLTQVHFKFFLSRDTSRLKWKKFPEKHIFESSARFSPTRWLLGSGYKTKTFLTSHGLNIHSSVTNCNETWVFFATQQCWLKHTVVKYSLWKIISETLSYISGMADCTYIQPWTRKSVMKLDVAVTVKITCVTG